MVTLDCDLCGAQHGVDEETIRVLCTCGSELIVSRSYWEPRLLLQGRPRENPGADEVHGTAGRQAPV